MFSFFKRAGPPAVFVIRQRIDHLAAGVFVIEDIKISKTGQAIVVLQSLLPNENDVEIRRHEIEETVASIKGVQKAMVILTGQRKPSAPVVPEKKAKSSTSDMDGLPPVVIAVASGKGGVGKSTVAVNLAVALSKMGKKVGILDADIYGPSLPRLLGAKDQKAEQGADGKLQPIDAHGLKAMSMGFLVNEETAMIWRGPMVQSALLQMLRDVNWAGLDILVIDMPPGTGDIHLTLAQRVPLSGGVVVSTPQDIALIDARKGLEMFQKVAVPILGIVENMSYYCCAQCGHREDIFGHGGARAEADKIGVPFLGEIPLHSMIRSMSDAGTPVTLSAAQSEQAKAFQHIAERVLSGITAAQRPAPTIHMED
ncbi:MAG TPA: iron-sulfur cluster carrier protein ApbC [Rhodospirillaceae bacterium]|nr:iron-sulfur cluster carrier protein ApbC [Rhodospirillaceae bacterium]